MVDDFGTESGTTTYILEIGTSDAVQAPTGDFTHLVFRTTGDFVEFSLTTEDSLISGDTLVTGGLRDDVYRWHVRAVDGAGNTGNFSATFSFTVDTSDPTAPVLESPSTGDRTDDKTPTFQWLRATDDLSGVASYTLEITSGDRPGTDASGAFVATVFSRDGIADVPETGDEIHFTLPEPLATGDYLWHVRAADRAGNAGDFRAAALFSVLEDITPPETPVLELPDEGATADTARPRFRWIFTGDTGDVSFGLKVTEDGGNLVIDQDGLQVTEFTPAQQLAGGSYAWRVVASDAAGNTTDSGESLFTVLGTPSGLTVSREPLFGVSTASGDYKAVFRWQEVPGAERYEVSVDHGPFVNIATGDPGASTGDIVTSGDAITLGAHHVFQVRAVTGDSTSRGGVATLFFSDSLTTGVVTSFTVATRDFLPLGGHVIQVSGKDSALNASEFERAELDFAVSQLVISLEPETQTITLPTSTASLSILIDPRGVRVDGAEISLDVLSPLTINSVSFAEGVTGDRKVSLTTADITATFDAARTEPFTLASVQVNTPSATAPDAPNVLLANTEGRRTVGRFEEKDIPAVLENATVVVNAAPSGGGGGGGGGGAPADDPPVANAGSPETVDEGDRVALNGSLSADPAGDPITLSWRAPSGVSLSDTTAARPSFVAPDGPANLNFTLTVTDAGGLSDSASVAITVRNVPPTITNVTASPSSVIAGGSTTISVTATDPAGAADPLEYSFDCDGNRSFEIGPQDGRSASCTIDEGPEQTVNVKVEDGDGGSDEDGVSVAVRNVAPTVDAGADVTINEGGTFFSSGAFTDPGADSWTATVDYDDGSGTESLSLSGRAFTLRHDYGDNGVFNVVVEVDDGDDTGTDTVTVTINNVSPDVADIANASTDEGDTFIHEGSFLDPGVEDTWTATVNYGDGSGAQTLALNPDNTFSLSQVYEDNGNFNVTVTVTDDDGGSDSSSFSVNVSNVAPVVDAGDGQSAFAGDTVDVLARFTDAGAGDTHAATIDWGDGTVELGSVDGNAGTAAGSHVYSVAGTFNVTVTVNDDDLGSDQDGLTVEVLVRVALPDEISITNFELSTTEPVPPESVTASFTVTNISNVGVTLNIDLFQNGDVVRSFTQFDLGPGDGRGLQHSLSEREPGTYAVQVFDQVRNYAIAPPQAAVSGLVIAPRVSGPRDTVTISAEVTNIGSVAGRFSVDLQIDGSSDVNEVRLVPGDSQTIVRFVRIPAQPPDSGVASTGPHSVNVGGLKGTYVIRPPDIRTDVRRQRGINRDTSRARGTDGQEFEIIEGDAFFGEGSITFSLPVRAPQGVNVASFADTTSGISVIGRDIQVPVRDPGGATILNLVGVLQQELQGAEDGESIVGTFERLRMVTQERQADLSADDPNVGRLGVSLDAVLDAFPAGVSVEATIKKELDAAARTSVEQAARQQGKTVANEAGMVSFETTNLDPVDDVGEVKVTMKVSALWVDIYGIENVRIAHISEDGSVENLVPVCTGPDGNNQYTCVGTTQRGLSEFSLLALVDIPAEFSARNLQITPAAVAPGEIAKITVEIVNDGFEAGSFSAILNLRRSEAGAGFDPIAVQEITLGSNESGIITFFVLREVEGDYQIEVEGRVESQEVV